MAFLLMNLAATAQSTGVHIGGSVFGGGNLANVGGNTSVLLNQAGTVVTGDIYGGGALADVGTSSSDTTEVTILKGTVNKDVYGGGLGDENHEPLVNGVVTVSIGNSTGGSATIGGYIFGCNNANGTPKDNVNVHIWSTAHTSDNTVPDLETEDIAHLLALSHEPTNFALQAVYGGGNVADFVPAASGKTALVYIHNCDNTVKMVYGGGRAAAVGRADDPEEEGDQSITAHTSITVEGGRIDTLFAGGDGHTKNISGDYLPADIYGNVGATIQGGYYTAVFGASNTSGTITGTKTVNINKTSPCADEQEELIGTLFGGANLADASGDASLTIACGAGKFGDVYGGCNLANITGNLTLTIEGGTFNNVYGGSKGRAASDPLGAKPANIDGNVTLNLNGGSMVNAFGGSNINGNITGSITVNVEATQEDCGLSITNVYGAGNETAYRPTDSTIVYPEVNVIKGTITGNVFGGGKGDSATVTANPKVTVSGGSIGGNVYGGGEQARTVGNTEVKVTEDTVSGTVPTISNKVFGGGYGSTAVVTANSKVTVEGGGSIGGDVYGGGEQANTSGNVEVNIEGGTITGDVYGGGALADVNTNGSNTTTVNILGGTLHDVYGGGLGNSSVAASVYGVVTVNIGATDGESTPTYSGSATYINAVYGCNNVNGSPKDDVVVNVYQTAHTIGTNTIDDEGYVIDQVFGGGNQANYSPNGNHGITTTIFGCYNTIRRVFGGGNAAHATNSSGTVASTIIYGGRFDYVFGGGNGEVSPANLTGNVSLAIHGGQVEHYFGGSNEQGTITGNTSISVDSNGPCELVIPTYIEEFFCGGNLADIVGNVVTEITCDPTMANVQIISLYGGCNQADITGNVELTVNGGNYDYIYGGSKGSESQSADISGDVTLNIYGGTIRDAVFGGCNVNGTIGGKIIVKVEDKGGYCPLSMENADVFGGGNLAAYEAPFVSGTSGPRQNYPEVNIINATVRNVFGGGNGDPDDATQMKGSVTGNPKVYINKVATPETYRGVVMGNVYGGGNAAKVDGSPTIELWRRAKVFGNVYGGGNEGAVTGDTKVIVNGDVVTP